MITQEILNIVKEIFRQEITEIKGYQVVSTKSRQLAESKWMPFKHIQVTLVLRTRMWFLDKNLPDMYDVINQINKKLPANINIKFKQAHKSSFEFEDGDRLSEVYYYLKY